jgi:hypothetical protein
LNSYSDVTLAHRDIVYNIREIHAQLSTGGGSTQYYEEGFVDLVDGPCSFRTIPALVAHHKSHLPSSCLLLLGVPQINDLDIKLDTHRKTRRIPLESYAPLIDFDADTRLQCRLSEKDLLAWAEHHHNTPVGHTQYSYLDVVNFEGMVPEEVAQLCTASETYPQVYQATKGALPALANHPPVVLNFKEGWKHVSVPCPKWGPGAIAVLTRWALEMLENGL